MQKPQDQRARTAKALTDAIRTAGLTDAQLSDATGVNYHAVRRMRLKGVTNWSKNAKALCTFFKLASDPPESPDDPSMAWIERSVRIAWDGTPEHRKLIEELLVVAGRYKVTPR